MPRGTSTESALSETLEAGGGLKQFRAVSEGGRATRDSPFGPPKPKDSPVETKALPPVKDAQIPKPKTVARAARPRPTEAPSNRDAPTSETASDPTPGTALALYPENVTVPLSAELRDRSEELAKAINRSRSVRKNRLTRNSVIRVALKCFLDEFTIPDDGSVNSEEELLEAARKRPATRG